MTGRGEDEANSTTAYTLDSSDTSSNDERVKIDSALDNPGVTILIVLNVMDD